MTTKPSASTSGGSSQVDEGKDHWSYTAELYLSNTTYLKVIDKKYGNGASKFIGEALKFYSENSES